MSIKEIMRFQTERELDKKPYSSLNEHMNIAEEMLESIGIDVPKENRMILQSILMEMATTMRTLDKRNEMQARMHNDSDRVDAYADIIVFAIGAIMKLGYSPEKVLVEVAREINSREGEMINGKFEKFLDEESKTKWYKADYKQCKK